MKTTKSFFLSVCIALILAGIVLAAGCVSNTAPEKSEITASPTPTPTSEVVVQTPEMTEVPTTIVTTSTLVPTKTTSLSNGLTITYPIDWELKESEDTAMRDYGRVTTNIANLYSPTYAYGDYIAFSIDVDPDKVSDPDQYFNLATVAVQKVYGTIEITHHTQTGNGLQGIHWCTDCNHYNLEFKTKTENRWYHFATVDGMFYIVTVKNPDLNYMQVYEMLKSVTLTYNPTSEKHR